MNLCVELQDYTMYVYLHVHVYWTMLSNFATYYCHQN